MADAPQITKLVGVVVAAVTVARAPFTKTALFDRSPAKLVPVMVAAIPGVHVAGETPRWSVR
jgi:hypothetical protein